MKTPFKFLQLGLCLILAVDTASASTISLSNISISDTSLTFTITGHLSGPAPDANRNYIFITTTVDGDDFLLASPFPNLIGGISSSNQGRLSIFPFSDGPADRIIIGPGALFGTEDRPFVVGEEFSGTVTVDASAAVVGFEVTTFVPSRFLENGYAVYWGRSLAQTGVSAHTGTLQGSGAIPEPTSSLLLFMSAVCTFWRRRRLERCDSISGRLCQTKQAEQAMPPNGL